MPKTFGAYGARCPGHPVRKRKQFSCKGSSPRSGSPIEHVPLYSQLSTKEIDPQLSSPLWNGTIPPEIRACIFEYALTEYNIADDWPGPPRPLHNLVGIPLYYCDFEHRLWEKETDYFRPSYTGLKKVSIALLLTCRSAYLEAWKLPPVTKEHVFWHQGGAPPLLRNWLETQYFSGHRWTKEHLALVKEVHWFTQQWWLQAELRKTFMQDLQPLKGLEKVTITMRRGDWQGNENNQTLGLNARNGNGDVAQMKADWKREDEGEIIPWNDSGWGCAFKHVASLKEIVLELETNMYKKSEMEMIVERAKNWKFPAADKNRVFSTEGLDVGIETWRGPSNTWTHKCANCGTVTTTGMKGKDCKLCEEIQDAKKDSLGPPLVKFKIRYRLK